MPGIPSPFSSDDSDQFDGYDEFVPENIPRPGEFLQGHDLLTGEDHVAFHETTRDVFEERGVYDMTFGYNLARLNLDHRHRNAGYRYAVEDGDPDVLRAEFTPTTPFCPQSNTLTIGSFRAWNGLSGMHDYEVVKVRLDTMHHNSDVINDQLRGMEETFLETGSVEQAAESVGAGGELSDGRDGLDAPF